VSRRTSVLRSGGGLLACGAGRTDDAEDLALGRGDDAHPDSYQNSPWRGANVAPMAANVEWDLYAGTPRSGKNGKPATAEGTEYLVRMHYNEKETAFKPSCTPVAKGSYFYDLNELKRCFGNA
jgi:hypothetical protein